MSSQNYLFTPTTPHVHKFRTEMCKNFEQTGKCKFGDEVSIICFVELIDFRVYFNLLINSY